MSQQKQGTIEDVLEILYVMQDSMVTKEELKEVLDKELKEKLKNVATKEDIARLDRRIDALEKRMEDGFAELRAEIKSVREDLKEVRFSLDKLERRTFEDTTAGTKEIIKLKHRVDNLETQVQKLQTI